MSTTQVTCLVCTDKVAAPLCHDAVAPHSVVVRPGQFVVHLRCFFDAPRAGRNSLGAAPSVQTTSAPPAVRLDALILQAS